MGEDIAVVLKPPPELKKAKSMPKVLNFLKQSLAKIDMQEERGSTFEKAQYMEKGSEKSQEELHERHKKHD